MNHLSVFCADIGSEARQRFGWAGIQPGEAAAGAARCGTSLQSLAVAIADLLNRGNPVALGFECPLFVPITEESAHLTAARVGEGSRAWCAGAGSGALATGLVQVVWLLRRIRSLVHTAVPAHIDWASFEQTGTGLLLWEAFVSGASKAGSHTADAEAGIRAFLASLPDPTASNAIRAEVVHSLIGAALLRTGWTSDLDVLGVSCLVIRA